MSKTDNTRNQRQARRREREKQWLEAHEWRSWEALHTALMNGAVRLILEKENSDHKFDGSLSSNVSDQIN